MNLARRSPMLFLILGSILVVLAGQVGLDQPWIRVPAGILVTLVAPGYAFLRVLQPGHLSRLTRMILSIPLSLSIDIVIAIILDVTSLGVRPRPMMLALSGVTAILLSITWARGMRDAAIVSPGRLRAWLRPPRRGELLTLTTIGGITLLAGAWAVIGFRRASQEHPLPFTELYVGSISGAFGEGRIDAAVRFGVRNQEQRTMAYDLLITSKPPGKPAVLQAEQHIEVAADERWEGSIVIAIACTDIVEVVLRLPGQATPYRRVEARPPCSIQPVPTPTDDVGSGQSNWGVHSLMRTTQSRSEDSANS